MVVSVGGPINEKSPEWEDVTWLYPRTTDVDEWNNYKLDRLSSPVIEIRCHDSVLDQRTGMPSNRRVPQSLVPTNTDDCGGLQKTVRLAIGAQVLLRRNIATDDGLVNGATGKITELEWSQADLALESVN